jgi:hypothetical protein
LLVVVALTSMAIAAKTSKARGRLLAVAVPTFPRQDVALPPGLTIGRSDLGLGRFGSNPDARLRS